MLQTGNAILRPASRRPVKDEALKSDRPSDASSVGSTYAWTLLHFDEVPVEDNEWMLPTAELRSKPNVIHVIHLLVYSFVASLCTPPKSSVRPER